MRLWKRASAILKDNNSICLAKLSRRTSFRHPDLESAIIKATSHDECSVDYKNSQRVFAWVRTSSSFLKPFIWALTQRMEKTRNWVVVIKGLMLLHGIFCCNVPVIKRIGRLPFDLSSFADGHSRSAESWGFNAFIRAYFAYLDKRCLFLSCDVPLDDLKDEKDIDRSLVNVLLELQRLQALLDLLIQIKPSADGMRVRLILEAMDCIVIEIFDIYSRVCRGIAGVLLGIFNAGKVESSMALRVLQKAASQGNELFSYFEFCKEFGVLNASGFPKVEHVPEEDIRVLEQMINEKFSEEDKESYNGDDKAIMLVKDPSTQKQENLDTSSKTIVTQNWVVFNDELETQRSADEFSFFGVNGVEKTTNCTDPFAASANCPPLFGGYNCDPAFTSSNGLLELEHYFNPIPASPATIGNQTNWILSL